MALGKAYLDTLSDEEILSLIGQLNAVLTDRRRAQHKEFREAYRRICEELANAKGVTLKCSDAIG